jgi:hypothetical protein
MSWKDKLEPKGYWGDIFEFADYLAEVKTFSEKAVLGWIKVNQPSVVAANNTLQLENTAKWYVGTLVSVGVITTENGTLTWRGSNG